MNILSKILPPLGRVGVGLSFLAFSSTSFAQHAGQIISGTVSDAMGPVMMANVVEIDASNRIVSSTQTDIKRRLILKTVE